MSIAAGCEAIVVSPPIVYDALRIMERFGYGFFDSQIIAAALACGAPVLYSEDLHHGQTVDGKLSIRSPFRLRAEQRTNPTGPRSAAPSRELEIQAATAAVANPGMSRDGTVSLFRTMLAD